MEALAQTFDIRERTVLSKTDNLNALFWQRRASTSSDKVPAHLLRLFGIHQRYHRYVPRHDYISGESNPVADALSRDFFLSWQELLVSLSSKLPVQPSSCQVWSPSPELCSSVVSALCKERLSPTAVLIEPRAADQAFRPGRSASLTWAACPLFKGRSTKLGCYKSSPDEYVVENLRPQAIQSGLNRLKVPYGALQRRARNWCLSSARPSVPH